MWAFFGLSDEYMESIYEQMFLLKYYGGFSILETYNFPIGLRDWFCKKLIKQKEIEAEEFKKSKK